MHATARSPVWLSAAYRSITVHMGMDGFPTAFTWAGAATTELAKLATEPHR